MIYIRCHNLSKNNKDFLQIFSIAKYIPKTTGHNIFASCYLSNKLKSFLTSFFFFFLSKISFYCYFIHRIRVQEVPSRVAEKLALFSSFFFSSRFTLLFLVSFFIPFPRLAREEGMRSFNNIELFLFCFFSYRHFDKRHIPIYMYIIYTRDGPKVSKRL